MTIAFWGLYLMHPSCEGSSLAWVAVPTRYVAVSLLTRCRTLTKSRWPTRLPGLAAVTSCVTKVSVPTRCSTCQSKEQPWGLTSSGDILAAPFLLPGGR